MRPAAGELACCLTGVVDGVAGPAGDGDDGGAVEQRQQPVGVSFGGGAATRVGGQRTLAGTGAMAGGVAAFVALEAVAKWLGGGYATGQVVFLRTVLAVPGALVLLLAVDGLGGLRPTGLRAHVACGGLMVTAQFAYSPGCSTWRCPRPPH